MLENIAKKTRNFSLVDFFNNDNNRSRKASFFFTKRQVICGLIPFYADDMGIDEVLHTLPVQELIKATNMMPYMLICLTKDQLTGDEVYICKRSNLANSEYYEDIIDRTKNLIDAMNEKGGRKIAWKEEKDNEDSFPSDESEEK